MEAPTALSSAATVVTVSSSGMVLCVRTLPAPPSTHAFFRPLASMLLLSTTSMPMRRFLTTPTSTASRESLMLSVRTVSSLPCQCTSLLLKLWVTLTRSIHLMAKSKSGGTMLPMSSMKRFQTSPATWSRPTLKASLVPLRTTEPLLRERIW